MLIETYVPNKIYMKDEGRYSSLPLCSFLKKKAKNCIELKNDKTSGFTFYFSGNTSYIIDPRGFAVSVGMYYLNRLLSNATIINGEIIGEYRWIFEKGNICIKSSKDIDQMVIKTEDELLEEKITSGKKGNIYKLPNGKNYIYYGRYFHFPFEIKSRNRLPLYKITPTMETIFDNVVEALKTLDSKDNFLNITPSVKNAQLTHMFVEQNKGYIKHDTSFVAYEDLGASDVTEEEIKSKLANIKNNFNKFEIEYLIECTSEYYLRPIPKSEQTYELNDSEMDKMKKASTSLYYGFGSLIYVNSSGHIKQEVYSRGVSYVHVNGEDKIKIPYYECKLKNDKIVKFTPFGVR